MEKRVRFKQLSREDGAVTTLELPNKEAGARFRKILKDNFPNLDIKSSEIVNGSEKVYLKIRDKQVAAIEKFAVEQSLETIRNRVDQFGVSEPEIIPQGKDRILIQLPGVKDPQRAINLIGKTALLEFKLLDEEHSLDEALKGNVPSGDIIAYGYRVESETGRRAKIPYLLKRKTLLTGESLEDAKVSISDRFGEAYVSLKFDSQGAKDFDRITAANVKKRLAIVLDGVVHSAPVIQERISGGNAQITGSFTMNEAHDLAIVLRAGALPAPVRILEQRTVGPSLGQDSIDKGILSIIVGSILVILFMVMYYNLSGIIADIALFLNIRIREELRLGKSPRAAIAGGYSKALLTIVDANVTTLIAALVLFQFGTGPIKGFAVTLSIGIICSMFTAIFVTRIIYDYFVWDRNIQRVAI